MTIHNQSHTMTDTNSHSAGNHKMFYSDGSGNITELAHGAAGTCLVSGGTEAAPSWSSLLGEVLVTCAGATPIVSDFSSQATGSHGFAEGTGGRVWKWYKNASGVFATELTSVPES